MLSGERLQARYIEGHGKSGFYCVTILFNVVPAPESNGWLCTSQRQPTQPGRPAVPIVLSPVKKEPEDFNSKKGRWGLAPIQGCRGDLSSRGMAKSQGGPSGSEFLSLKINRYIYVEAQEIYYPNS